MNIEITSTQLIIGSGIAIILLLVIFLVKKRKKKQVAWIKCKKCGEVYPVKDQNEWGERNISYNCSKCNSDIKVAFCGYCDDCEKFIGFRKYTLGNRLLRGAKTAVKEAVTGLLNPVDGIMSGIKTLERLVDSIPSASAAGTCPFCNNVYLECPQCGYTVKFPVSVEQSDTIVNCSNCHTKMKHP
ncbi:hypothetical protein EZS27_013968 [termite gut metagenome]|uniref:Uncharacterized protein n=1 Tax=termite gut metagenome TaxID=433724 RepID=A0A5J4RVW7_9ZZZZ